MSDTHDIPVRNFETVKGEMKRNKVGVTKMGRWMDH